MFDVTVEENGTHGASALTLAQLLCQMCAQFIVLDKRVQMMMANAFEINCVWSRAIFVGCRMCFREDFLDWNDYILVHTSSSTQAKKEQNKRHLLSTTTTYCYRISPL